MRPCPQTPNSAPDTAPSSQRSTHEQPPQDVRLRSGPSNRPTSRQREDHRPQVLLRKEVIQPHLPVRLPCYDFVPIAGPTFDDSLERIHRSTADLRLLATPTSWGRVADPNPN